MSKKGLKREIVACIILFILVFIILKCIFYEYIPRSSVFQKDIEYSKSEETNRIIQEISNPQNEDLEIFSGHYNINSNTLDEYKKENLYKSGNSNPFKYVKED